MARAEGITVTATGPALDALAGLADRMSDLTPVMEDIAAVLERNLNIRFDTKTDPAGAPWAPLLRSSQRRAKKLGGSLLERTRQMRNSIATRVTADSVEIGFGVPYAAYHEFGTVKMARRGLLTADPATGALGELDQADLLELLTGYLQGGVE